MVYNLQLGTREEYGSALRLAVDLTEKILSNNRIIILRHFLSGKPASLLEESSPDWLPTLNLGHSKQKNESGARAAEERWERAKARESLKCNTEVEEMGDSEEVLSDTGGVVLFQSWWMFLLRLIYLQL